MEKTGTLVDTGIATAFAMVESGVEAVVEEEAAAAAANGSVVGISLQVNMNHMVVEAALAGLAVGSARIGSEDICPSEEVLGDVRHMMEEVVVIDQLDIWVGVVAVHSAVCFAVHFAVRFVAQADHSEVGSIAGVEVDVRLVAAEGLYSPLAVVEDEQRKREGERLHCVSASQSAEVNV